ncbi:MAG: hypothetical protein HKM03_06485 [Steroidobacteraceae bacterium]|nr:hypothetical protein [Steroidobacteraceae bacterium]
MSLTITLQRLEPVTRWRSEVAKIPSGIQLVPFTARDRFNIDEPRYAVPFMQGFGIAAFERPDGHRAYCISILDMVANPLHAAS